MTSNSMKLFVVLLRYVSLSFICTFLQTILCELDSANLDSKEVCSLKAIKMVIQQILKQLK